jgi:hypothetical protein
MKLRRLLIRVAGNVERAGQHRSDGFIAVRRVSLRRCESYWASWRGDLG